MAVMGFLQHFSLLSYQSYILIDTKHLSTSVAFTFATTYILYAVCLTLHHLQEVQYIRTVRNIELPPPLTV